MPRGYPVPRRKQGKEGVPQGSRLGFLFQVCRASYPVRRGQPISTKTLTMVRENELGSGTAETA
jgi:hypothetical protein